MWEKRFLDGFKLWLLGYPCEWLSFNDGGLGPFFLIVLKRIFKTFAIAQATFTPVEVTLNFATVYLDKLIPQRNPSESADGSKTSRFGIGG